MSMKMKLGLAGSVVALAAIAILVVLLPVGVWSAPVIAATALVAILLGGFFYLPAPLAPSSRSEESRLALIGPSGVVVSLALLGALAAFAVGLTGYNALSWSLTILTSAGLIVSALVLHASSGVIDQAVASQPDNSERMEWQGLLNEAVSRNAGRPHTERCVRLVESLRYTASSIKNQTVAEDAAIRAKLVQLLGFSPSESDAAFTQAMDEIEALVMRRQQQLVASRSKA